MAGKFINTVYYDTQDSLVNMHEDLVQNPFYLFNDKKGTKVTYYNINTEKTTLDPASKLAYTNLGEESPIRYNVIHDLYLYQFNKAELNFDNGEFGLESAPIEGESYILPNTIEPIEGDYFEVEHVKDNKWLFRVHDVQRDTLENGSNVYKISWKIDRTGNEEIVTNTVEEYKYVNTVEGTNLKAVVELTKYDIAKRLDDLSVSLGNYFRDLFYDKYVQTFIYKWYNEYNMYDPFAIEFIIRNKILSSIDDFIFVNHQTEIPTTFSIDYDKSIFRAFELQSIDKLKRCKCKSQADYIVEVLNKYNALTFDYNSEFAKIPEPTYRNIQDIVDSLTDKADSTGLTGLEKANKVKEHSDFSTLPDYLQNIVSSVCRYKRCTGKQLVHVNTAFAQLGLGTPDDVKVEDNTENTIDEKAYTELAKQIISHPDVKNASELSVKIATTVAKTGRCSEKQAKHLDKAKKVLGL